MHQIELLAPAKNIECGIAAINHGADAVYIGAPKYGARKSAGNSIDEIKRLIEHAHFFKSKVYIALNTIIFDDELIDVEKIINQLYHAGADAIIIQDMGILELDLPPIPLHASTQTDNRTVEKVQFLEKAGFDQVVLARELSVYAISNIANNTNVKLESFIHGALCVSYSGQCYMSASNTNRSANRGECSQPCRLPYTVSDENGNILLKDKHVLSLKDLNLSDQIEQLIDAGIHSLKIEGRLKEIDYVKNITSHYRQLIDTIILKRKDLARSSSGKTEIPFVPNPEKSFSRGFSSYFINGRQDDIWNIDTPKSFGEKIGKVAQVFPDHFVLTDESLELRNGDGICFLNRNKTLNGTNINQVNNKSIVPDSMQDIYTGATLFRNRDQVFNTAIKNSNSNRRIEIKMNFNQVSEDTFELAIIDEDMVETCTTMNLVWQIARNESMALENIQLQLSKLGESDFYTHNINISLSESLFFPVKEINRLRREAINNQKTKRIKTFFRTSNIKTEKTTHHYPFDVIDYKGNISNKLALKFYERHGIKTISKAFELNPKTNGVNVMTTKHCILYMLDKCAKHNKAVKQPKKLKLTDNNNNKYNIDFDCNACEMNISKIK